MAGTMPDRLTLTEIDIQIAGTRLFDYLFDLVLTQNMLLKHESIRDLRAETRLLFGEAVVELVRAIKADTRKAGKKKN